MGRLAWNYHNANRVRVIEREQVHSNEPDTTCNDENNDHKESQITSYDEKTAYIYDHRDPDNGDFLRALNPSPGETQRLKRLEYKKHKNSDGSYTCYYKYTIKDQDTYYITGKSLYRRKICRVFMAYPKLNDDFTSTASDPVVCKIVDFNPYIKNRVNINMNTPELFKEESEISKDLGLCVSSFKSHNNQGVMIHNYKGESLDKIVPDAGFSENELDKALGLAIKMCIQVRKLHLGELSENSTPYAHRDIKPANFAVKSNDGEDEVSLIDFGLARKDLNELSKDTSGTPSCMPYKRKYIKKLTNKELDLFALQRTIYLPKLYKHFNIANRNEPKIVTRDLDYKHKWLLSDEIVEKYNLLPLLDTVHGKLKCESLDLLLISLITIKTSKEPISDKFISLYKSNANYKSAVKEIIDAYNVNDSVTMKDVNSKFLDRGFEKLKNKISSNGLVVKNSKEQKLKDAFQSIESKMFEISYLIPREEAKQAFDEHKDKYIENVCNAVAEYYAVKVVTDNDKVALRNKIKQAESEFYNSATKMKVSPIFTGILVALTNSLLAMTGVGLLLIGAHKMRTGHIFFNYSHIDVALKKADAKLFNEIVNPTEPASSLQM